MLATGEILTYVSYEELVSLRQIVRYTSDNTLSQLELDASKKWLEAIEHALSKKPPPDSNQVVTVKVKRKTT